MVSTRGTALLVTPTRSVEQWMAECVTSMGLGYVSIQDMEQLDAVQDPLCLCLLDVAGAGSVSWDAVLFQARRRHPLLPAVLVSSETTPAVPRQALGTGIVDILSTKDDVAGLRARLERVVRRVDAVADIRRAIDVLGSLSGTGDADRGHQGQDKSREGRPDRSVLLIGAERSLGEAAVALERAEMRVGRAETFELARAAVEQQHFQVLVVDNDLPDTSGLVAMRDMATALPDARILFVVGFTGADDAVQALRWGAASFLIKPIGPEQLVEQVQALMEADAQQAGTPTAMVERASEAVALLEGAIARLCSLT